MHKAIAKFLFFCWLLLVVSMLLFHAAKAQTVGDDLAVALANHGMDPLTAAVAAPAIEVAIHNNQAVLDRITALEQQVGIGQILVQAETFDSVAPMPANAVLAIGGSGIITNWVPAKTTFTYAVHVALAGNYQFAVRARSANIGTLSVNGQTMSIPQNVLTLTGTQYAYETVPGPVLPLGAGANIITLTVVSGSTNLDYFTLAKQ